MEARVPEDYLVEIITELKKARRIYISIIDAAEPALFDDELQRVDEAEDLIANGIDRLSKMIPGFDQLQ